jgi:cytochrome c peroxidase
MNEVLKKYGVGLMSLAVIAGLSLFVGLSAFIGPPAFTAGPGGPTPYALNYPSYFGNRINTPDDNPLTDEGVRLGRMLFYEKRLSANNTVSCASCHLQSRAFTDGRAFSIGFDGIPTRRNSMSLSNLLWIRHFFWDGRAASLEVQAAVPLTDPHEMGQSLDSSVAKLTAAGTYTSLFTAAFAASSTAAMPASANLTAPTAADPTANPITPARITKALAQFERTLISSNSPYDRYIRGEYQLTAAERRGLELFFGPASTDAMISSRNAGCSNCHGGPRTITETYHNNGLDRLCKDSGRADVTGMAYDLGRFRTVGLRNIALTGPYMHDGRFTTLEEVVDHYSEHIEPSETLSPSLKDTLNKPTPLHLTRQEKADIVAFLKTLTDSTFITDPHFSDPFVKK